MKFLRLLLVSIMAFFLLSFFSATPVYAMANPSNITVLEAFCFPHAVEFGDMVFVMRYKVGYAPIPVERPEDIFFAGLYDPTGAVLYGSRPVYYYGENIGSVYFTPTQVTSLGLVNGTAYVLRISGNVSIFGSLTEGLNKASHTMAASEYYSSTYTQALMLTQANILQANLGTTLVTSGKLNPQGGQYFNFGFPELGTIAPNLFQIVKSEINLTYRNWTSQENYSAVLATHRGYLVQEMIQSIGVDLFHMTYNWAAVWFSVMVYLLVASFAYPFVRNAGWSIIIAFPAAAATAYIGVADNMLRIIILVVFAVAFVFGIYFILGKFA